MLAAAAMLLAWLWIEAIEMSGTSFTRAMYSAATAIGSLFAAYMLWELTRLGIDRHLHVGVGDGDEAVVGALVAQRAVQQRQHGAGGVLVGGGGAQRVAGERGDRCGVGALALDVADEGGPGAVAGAEEVVEVAAEFDALTRRPEADGGAQPGHRRQPARS